MLTQANKATDHPNDPKATRHRMEYDLISLESDHKKILRRIDEIASTIRQIDARAKRIMIEKGQFESEKKNLDTQKFHLEQEIATLKKRIKMI